MPEEDLYTVTLKNDFYRDSFGKVIFVIISMIFAIGLLVALSVYLHLDKPPPINFSVADEWRVQADVPVDKPYLSTPDLLQWVTTVFSTVFVYDFINYKDQLKAAAQYFTTDGWKVFSNQLNIYANYNNVQTYKTVINGVPAGAPFIINQGLLSGRYAWWVQMPITLKSINYNQSSTQNLILRVLVVRIPTLNNLNGVGIDNVIIEIKKGNPLGQT